MLKRTFLAVAILCVMLAIPLFSASAGQPTIDYFPIYYYWEMDCGDFQIAAWYEGWDRWIADWDALRIVHEVHSGGGGVYRLDDPENIITNFGSRYNHWVEVYRLGKGQGWMRLGTYDHISIPGVGTFWINAGRVAYDNEGNIIREGGHIYYEGEVEDGLCTLFAE